MNAQALQTTDNLAMPAIDTTSPLALAATPVELATQSINGKYADLGGAGSALGATTTAVTAATSGAGFVRQFQNGVIGWNLLTGAHVLHGPILTRWNELGADKGFLGFPTTDVTPGNDVRADLLPTADAAKVRQLLTNYLDQRVLFYSTRDGQQLRQISTKTGQLQSDLWSAVQAPAVIQPTPVVALAVSGMNDVLNSEGYTQAAWWNRIPVAAWSLVTVIAICCNWLIGYGAHRTTTLLFVVLPLAVSISFFLIADIDSPRGGLIRVQPQNLVRLSQALHGR